MFDRIPLYPALVTAAAIFNVFVDSTAPVSALVRPLAIATLGIVAIQLIATLVVRNRHVAAILAIGLVIALLGYIAIAVAIPIVLLALALVAVAQHRRIDNLPWPTVTRMGNLIGAILVTIAAISVVQTTTVEVVIPPAGDHTRATGAPDIYVLLLDGHPSLATIETQFGADPSALLAGMERLGFEWSSESDANYNATTLTLASMLNMADVRDVIPPAHRSTPAEFRASTAAITHARALSELRNFGYEIVTLPSPISDVTISTADRVLANGGVTDFELTLLQLSGVRRFLPDLQREWMPRFLRQRIDDTLNGLVGVAAEKSSRPKFVFAHLMSPHPPYLFEASGAPREAWPCFPQECSLFDGGQRYGTREQIAGASGQVEYLDRRVLETAQGILSSSPRPPVIIVMSDHGHRHDLDDTFESVSNLFLAYTPNRSDLFPDDVTPVNVMNRLLNSYLGTSIPLVSDNAYWVDIEHLRANGLLNYRPIKN